MSSPPPLDLQVLCRKLSSIPTNQLPRALPALTRHVARCGRALSTTPQDQKRPKDDNTSRTTLLVHKLKTTITTLLIGRSADARFAAVGLIKAVVDVGGWETLRGAEPWVRGLLSIVQRGDSLATKEMAVVTLTRIYTLLQPFQTLIREIATPTIPAFATACLQLIKPTASASPASIVETICDAFAILIPHYPTTFRPFATQIRSAVRVYLAPTNSDATFLVTHSLQRAASRLVVSLHHVVAKSGSCEDWAKMVGVVIRELHATADQVLRAVDEAWYSSDGYVRTAVNPDGEPSGGSAAPDQLPPWTGLSAGVERLIGLFTHLADYLMCPTRGSVAVPLSAIMGAISRVGLIAKPSSKSQDWHQFLETNPAIGREEKEELWSLIPQVHVAAMDLATVMIQRFQQGLVPLVSEMLDNLVRIFKSGMDMPATRQSGYHLLAAILSIAGPTLSKQAVAAVEPLMAACCRDLQQDAGLLKPDDRPAAPDSKKKGVANADLFLRPSASTSAVGDVVLDTDHRAAAERLLPLLFSSLPQQNLKASLRSLVDKTAILTRNRDAMLASVLHPYRDRRGRIYPSILPHLTRQYPHDQGLEVIRTNLRVGSRVAGSTLLAAEDVNEMDQGGIEDGDDAVEDETEQQNPGEMTKEENQAETSPKPGTAKQSPTAAIPAAEPESKPFASIAPPSKAARLDLPPPKRKHDGSSAAHAPKRHEAAKPAKASNPNLSKPDEVEGAESVVDTITVAPLPLPPPSLPVDEDDDSDESVHLNMELDDDEAGELEDEVDG